MCSITVSKDILLSALVLMLMIFYQLQALWIIIKSYYQTWQQSATIQKI